MSKYGSVKHFLTGQLDSKPKIYFVKCYYLNNYSSICVLWLNADLSDSSGVLIQVKNELMLKSTQASCKVIQDSLGIWISRCGCRIESTGFRSPRAVVLHYLCATTGTLSSDDDDGNENVAKKLNLPSFKLNRVYLDPLNMSNAGDVSWS